VNTYLPITMPKDSYTKLNICTKQASCCIKRYLKFGVTQNTSYGRTKKYFQSVNDIFGISAQSITLQVIFVN